MITNPGFENVNGSIASNWSFYHNGYSLSNLSHSGNKSIFMASPNESTVYGAYQKIVFNESMKKFPLIKISGWSKAENVSGERDYDYSIYVDITYTDGSHLWAQVAEFDTGDHDWQYAEKIIFLEKEVDYLYVYALFRYHSGSVWFDDIRLTAADYEYINSQIISKGEKLCQHSVMNNISFNVSYIPHDRFIEVKSEVESLSNQDISMTAYFSLPLNLTGWIWWNDIRNFETLNLTSTHKNWKWFGEERQISPYPLSCISNNNIGIAYGIPLDNPIIYRISYSPYSYKIEFDLALTNESRKANLSFIIYKNDYPEWGFRDALKKYYEIFPQYFVKRVKKEGIWMPFVDISTINNSEDFGFAFHEGNNNVAWDDENGIYSFVYTEPWFYWQYMGDYTQKPSWNDAIQRLNENLNSSDEWKKRNSQAVITSGSYAKNGSYLFYITNAPWVGGSGWAALFATNSDPDIEENGLWNKAHVVWNLSINPAFENASLNNATLDGVYLDSLEGYFWYMNDYRREHFKNLGFPLSFDEYKNPCINELFTHYKFTKNVSNEMHLKAKLVMANSVGFYSAFFFPLLDVAGTETDWLPDGKYQPDTDEIFNFRRALSYQKPYLLLMNTNFSLMSYDIVELYFKKCTFYGIYPSMFSHNACNDIYWENSTLYNRDRPLFKKYIPVIKEINMAGWEPVTFAKCNNSAVYVERFGSNYFTLHNPTNHSQKFSLTIYANEISIENNVDIVELIANKSIAYEYVNGNIIINDTILANDTWVLKIMKKAYYVAPWGNDANDGSFFAPWRTIQHAIDATNNGNTIYVRNGIYHENIIISGKDNITISRYENEEVAIDGGNGSIGLYISSSRRIKIDGIEIANCSDTGIWVVNSSNILLSNCIVHDCFYGIGFADGCHDFVLENITIYNFTLYGFDASPSGGKPCYNGTIINCKVFHGVDTTQNVDGFALGHGTQHGFSFIKCYAYDVFDGFDISACNTTLQQCSAHDCWNGGYKIWQDNVSLINCLAYNNNISNAELDWDGSAGIVTLQNCDFIASGVYNIWIENSSDKLRMYNCILANGNNIGLAFEERDAGNYEGDYNIFHNSNAARAIAVGYTDEFSLDDIATGAWTNYSGQDAHSLVCYNSSSLFVNINEWDFHLASGSIAIDNGTSYNAPSFDYDGIARPRGNGYDIGAYEY